MDEYVKEEQDIIENFKYFIKNEKRDDYIQLLKKGRNFIPIKKGNEFYFIPSKFAGYINNNFEIHKKRKAYNRDGRDTDKEISKIFKETPTKNQLFEKYYKKLCKKYSITEYKYKRKYWPSRNLK